MVRGQGTAKAGQREAALSAALRDARVASSEARCAGDPPSRAAAESVFGVAIGSSGSKSFAHRQSQSSPRPTRAMPPPQRAPRNCTALYAATFAAVSWARSNSQAGLKLALKLHQACGAVSRAHQRAPAERAGRLPAALGGICSAAGLASRLWPRGLRVHGAHVPKARRRGRPLRLHRAPRAGRQAELVEVVKPLATVVSCWASEASAMLRLNKQSKG